MKDVKRLLYVVVCAAFFIGLYILSDIYAGEAIGKYAYEISDGSGKLKSNEKVTLDSLSIEKQISDYTSTVNHQNVTVSFVGDITFESGQLERYYNESSESFDFSNSFQYITRYLVTSNFVVGNLEAVMAGPDEDYDDVFDQYGTAGFLYNAPESAAQNLKDAGISMLQTANEHAGDFGLDGIKSTLDYLAEAGIKTTGTQKTAQDKRYTVASISGLKFAFVSYTNDVNIGLDDGNDYAVNSLDNYDSTKIKQMCEDVRSARRDDADFVVAMVYAGDATAFEPDDTRKGLFDQLFEAGADIVIGTEPYAVQPLEIRDLKGSDGTNKKGIAIYSLGTFLGCEQYNSSSGVDNDLSAILDIVIDKEGNKKAKITGIRITPTCITYTEDDIFVLPAAEVKNNSTKYENILDEEGMERVEAAYEDLIPWMLHYTDLEGSYQDNTYVINF